MGKGRGEASPDDCRADSLNQNAPGQIDAGAFSFWPGTQGSTHPQRAGGKRWFALRFAPPTRRGKALVNSEVNRGNAYTEAVHGMDTVFGA